MQHVWKVLNKPNTNTISETKTTKLNISKNISWKYILLPLFRLTDHLN